MSGPLEGLRIVEIAGIGPGPFCAMMLADAGADIVRVDRLAASSATGREGGAPEGAAYAAKDFMNRNRRSIAVDLKSPLGTEIVLALVARADGLIEGFRPGVAERLGIGPEACKERNPRLVYGRMTGWGQSGPLCASVGHDINYIAVAGALDAIGRCDSGPVPPLNLVGDFGGGGMLLAYGMVCALLEAARTGLGQVVDAAMVDGAALLTTFIHGMMAMGLWSSKRGTNLLDSGAPFYDVYQTADDKYVAVGALEPQFYAALVAAIDGDAVEVPEQMDRSRWPEMRTRFAAIFRTKTREEWCTLLEGSDACIAPVLGLDEAPDHPHLAARATFVEIAGERQPAPAPRFSRTPGEVRMPPPLPGEHTAEVLDAWGVEPGLAAAARSAGALRAQ